MVDGRRLYESDEGMNRSIPSFHHPRTGFSLILLMSGAALILMGCGPSIPQLRATAASEMNCPVPELELERVDSDTMAVIGCGRETIYSSYCDKTDAGKTCGWRADPTSDAAE